MPFGMLEKRPRDQRNVAEGRAAESGDHSGARGRRIAHRARQVVQILLRDWLELFEIVFRVQPLIVDRLLADDGVKEVAALRHAPARRNGHIALGIDQSVAPGVDRCVEISGHQHFEPVETPALPALSGKAEHGVARKDAHHVDAHRGAQVFLDKGKHLEGLVHANGAFFQAVVVAQRRNATGVNAGDGASAEVDGYPVRLLVTQRGQKPLAAGGRSLHCGACAHRRTLLPPSHPWAELVRRSAYSLSRQCERLSVRFRR